MHFLENSLQLIEQYMYLYGYWAVFFGVMLENAGLPIPGETILLVAGYLCSRGTLQLPLVMLIAASGAAVGDNIGFAIGHHFGRDILLRFGRFIFITPRRLDHLSNYFSKHGNKTILVARFITGLRVIGAILAGASKMPWRIFVVYNIAGAILWSIVISSLGYLFGQSLPSLVRWVGRSGSILLLAAIVGGILLWRIRTQRAKK
ncbi:MAG: DedA family protein [Acidobacteriota bacterium]